MDKTPLLNLDLRSALIYEKIDKIDKTEVSAADTPKTAEYLQCYELNPVLSRSIQPQRAQFLGKLIFCGVKTAEKPKNEVSLPQGSYLFTQQRTAGAQIAFLEQDEWLDMAIEQQKDGLWERNKLGNLLYVRFLYEDGASVTQLFREVI